IGGASLFDHPDMHELLHLGRDHLVRFVDEGGNLRDGELLVLKNAKDHDLEWIGEDLELPEVGHDLIRSLSCAGTAGHSSSPGLTGFPGSFVWSPLPLWHNACSMDEPHPPRRTSCMRALSTAYVFGSTPGHPWPPGPIPSLARQAARSGQEIRDVDRPPPRAVGLATRHLAGVGGRPEPCRGDRQVTGF